MVREALAENVFAREKHFRWRGGAVSRLEGISDAVFAFAITLLVVSLEVPKTYAQLLSAIQGFFGFAVCFLALIAIWYGHYLYFRRFGFEDGLTNVINGVLLFLILFYIYPMKFMVGFLVEMLRGDFRRIYAEMIRPDDVPDLMIIYSVGYAAVLAIFALMYWRAYRNREVLALDGVEAFLTRKTVVMFGSMIGVAALSIVLSIVADVMKSGILTALSGACYFLTWPATAIAMRGTDRRVEEIRRLEGGDAG